MTGDVLDVLVEVADVAADLLPWLEREGNYGHEAEGEPLPVGNWSVGLCDICGLIKRTGRARATPRASTKWDAPALVDVTREIAAVLTLTRDILVALEARGEGWESR